MSDATPEQATITQLLAEMHNGDPEAINRLYPMVYKELRRLAANIMRSYENHGHTLQPTALVAESYLRLVGAAQMNLKNRMHFFAVASRAMRQVLVDHARAKFASKRGGRKVQVELEEFPAESSFDLDMALAVDEALSSLEALDPRQATIVQMQYFAGNTINEIAAFFSLSARTVKRELQTGKMYIAQRIRGNGKAE